MSDGRCQGRVLEYDPERGYGRLQDSQERIFFVHYSDLIDEETLKAGQAVKFEAVLHRKGNIARRVQVV